MNKNEQEGIAARICSFCAKKQSDVPLLFEKPGSAICSHCVSKFIELLKDSSNGETTQRHTDCSFCKFLNGFPTRSEFFEESSETQREIKTIMDTISSKKQSEGCLGLRLIRSESAAICDECLNICEEITSSREC